MRNNLPLLLQRLEQAKRHLEEIIPTLTDADAADYRVIEGAQDAVKGVSEVVHYSTQNKTMR